MSQTLLRLVGTNERAVAALRTWSRLKRTATRGNARLLREYVSGHKTRKLHVGGGWYRLNGWLNTDIDTVPDVMYMDATRPFPIRDGQFDFVYSEHMIEHIPYRSGRSMLAECYRVLQPGGTVRIVTPDLRSVLSLTDAPADSLQARYVAWFCSVFCEPGVEPTWDQAINTFFYSWGHRHLYTEETLRKSLEAAGFRNVRRTRLMESEQDELRGLANEARHPAGFLDFESLTLEADKP